MVKVKEKLKKRRLEGLVGVLSISQTKDFWWKINSHFLEKNNRSWKYQLFFLLLKHPQYTCHHTLFITQDTMSFFI